MSKNIKYLIVFLILFGCGPLEVTNPIPMMNKITTYWNTDSFRGTVELVIPYEGIIHESYFRFQRQDIESKKPYIISIETFSDTINVSDNEITEVLYEKQNIPCSTYRIYSEHSVKMHVQIIIYQIFF